MYAYAAGKAGLEHRTQARVIKEAALFAIIRYLKIQRYKTTRRKPGNHKTRKLEKARLTKHRGD